ncbi:MULTISPECIES: peptidoglycan DD-metalloendopeptidase family protein [unclassified Undibacterium]|uniref:peptidoglycan DD-metalloendopeptidase family protein n=1 Tax=unclassified Undibacterium TaxID=2630295 RepID=UPI002AC8E2BC|nr:MULTISPECIES: peptidoglycan DD-metalloendopeptidase family protein [unclassified Undibacterium]MEB0138354.1 peptidoglycan DD-metalloendopeptidase family protein [Undibacterium sp. CCC2.1]MEB0172731.1 peptidoglycan DD-metalloendopeptidase family protein [Undibacterium sp. CCC1.1]MEB0174729.1 peptidoglycan DD-metalloendopeptidase family protein [Undibacterium sp. CCC3.4]MEB0213926.1 peptidoglycan DD-metalloendopeptidase family protein [Undibacterium sp. 5I2]WPX42650.1 peptidoglycan DD-metallo
MKKLKYVAFPLWPTAMLLVLGACTTPTHRAPVVERGAPAPGNASDVAPPPKLLLKTPENTRGSYVVKRGDTLYRIALEHGQSYNDLVVWNNLSNPNDIKVDQVLRVTPAEAGSSAVQTTGINNSVLEVKPLGAATQNKSSPLGNKRPYSDANLAELQKSESSAAAPLAKLDPIIPAKASDKPADVDAIEWIWPVEGKLLAGFDDAKNKGLDISGKMGQDVNAAAAGKVMYAGSGIRGYGNLVIVKHSSSLLSAYAHNKTILVKEGQAISKGQKIAEMGNSDSDVIKLHFEIRLQGKPVDPVKYLPTR